MNENELLERLKSESLLLSSAGQISLIKQVLHSAFIWKESKNGADYWLDVLVNLGDEQRKQEAKR